MQCPDSTEAALRVVRSTLHRLGYRFRLHRADLPGRPDVVLPRWRMAIFVVDCARHPHRDCPRAGAITAAPAPEEAARVARACEALAREGWESLIVQTCEANDPDTLRYRLDIAIQGRLIAARE